MTTSIRPSYASRSSKYDQCLFLNSEYSDRAQTDRRGARAGVASLQSRGMDEQRARRGSSSSTTSAATTTTRRRTIASSSSSLTDVASQFWALGWTAFGGPTAHLGLFESVFVQRLGWCSSSHFTEVVAVASALPGPTSTQVSFALGLVRGHGSLVCGLVSGFLFQYPGLLLMSVAGYLYASYAPVGPARGEHVMHAVNVGGAAAGGRYRGSVCLRGE